MSHHPFEKSGLGKAPYRCMSSGPLVAAGGHRGGTAGYEAALAAGHEPVVGGTCQHCGTALKNAIWFESADKAVFYVGVSCADKAGEATAARKARSGLRSDKKARETARIKAAISSLASDSVLIDRLSSQPHPNQWRAEKGDTLLDYLRFRMQRSGHAGMLRVCMELGL